MIHPRSEWEAPGQRVTGPSPTGQESAWVIHYAGAGTTPTEAAMPAYLRGQQNYSLTQNGYSLPYNYAVTIDGSQWELRGRDIRNAANKGSKPPYDQSNYNAYSQSILVAWGDQQGPLPATAVAAINAIIATRPGRQIQGHQDVEWTECPGAGTLAQINDGTIGYHQLPAPPLPIPEDPTMLEHLVQWTHSDRPGTFLIGTGPAVYLTPNLAAFYRELDVPKISESGDAADTAFSAYMAQAGLA
jgi:hypothetical protein